MKCACLIGAVTICVLASGVPAVSGRSVMTIEITNVESNLDTITKLLRSISNKKRMVVICALAGGEKSVGELEKIVKLSQSALSQHLAKLRRDEVVKTRRSAQTIYYSIKCTKAGYLLESLNEIYGEQ